MIRIGMIIPSGRSLTMSIATMTLIVIVVISGVCMSNAHSNKRVNDFAD